MAKFFCYVDSKCPWLIVSGPDIHPFTWNKVGKDINDLIKQGEEIPDAFFAFYGIIRDILKDAEKGGDSARLLALMENLLASSQPPSSKTKSNCLKPAQGKPCGSDDFLEDGSHNINSPCGPSLEKLSDPHPPPLVDDFVPPEQPLAAPLTPPTENKKGKPTSPKPRQLKQVYPVICKNAPGGDLLHPATASEAGLEEEAARSSQVLLIAKEQTRNENHYTSPPPYYLTFPSVPPKERSIQSPLPPSAFPSPTPLMFPGEWRAFPSAPPPETQQAASLSSPDIQGLLKTKQALTKQITGLKDVLQLQRELKDLTQEIHDLQINLIGGPINTPQTVDKHPPSLKSRKSKSSNKPPPVSFSFPVMTRLKASQNNQENNVDNTRGEENEGSEPAASDSEEGDICQEDSQSDEGQDNPHPQVLFKKLKIKHIKELHSAVKNYGVAVPFTLAILEDLAGDGHMLPGEWTKVVQSVLTRGQYLTWKAEFTDKAESQAVLNKKEPQGKMASWSADKITGRGKYASEDKQKTPPRNLDSNCPGCPGGLEGRASYRSNNHPPD